MKQELMTEVMQQMLPYLDNAQLKQLRQVMEQTLFHYEVAGTEDKREENDSNDIVARFIAAKRIEGCSEKTLKYYQTTIDAMVSSLGSENDDDYIDYIGYFYGHKNNYLILGDHYYWYMGGCYPENMAVDLINRTTTDYLEYRDGAYYYKEKKPR